MARRSGIATRREAMGGLARGLAVIRAAVEDELASGVVALGTDLGA